MLTAVCLLSSQQAAPTANTMRAAFRLLGYAKLHPNHCLVFKPSDMILRIHSGASYLNRSKSGSTAGGFHYLGTTDPDFSTGLFSATAPAFLLYAKLCRKQNTLAYSVTARLVLTNAKSANPLVIPNPPPTSAVTTSAL